MTYREPGLSGGGGDGDGPKQVPTLLRASATAWSRSPTTRLLAPSKYINPPPPAFLLLTLFQCLSDLCCSWPSATVCLCTTDTNRFWRVMWNYPELFKSHRPYLSYSAACIAFNRCGFVYARLSLYFSTWVVLALSAWRKPLVPHFDQAAGEVCRPGRGFAPKETGRGISFVRAAPAIISHWNLCSWKCWYILLWLRLKLCEWGLWFSASSGTAVRWFQRGWILFL